MLTTVARALCTVLAAPWEKLATADAAPISPENGFHPLANIGAPSAAKP